MINFLPEQIREGLIYSKRNRRIVNYLGFQITLALLILLSFLIANFYLASNNQFFITQKEKSQQVIDSYGDLLHDAKKLEERISSIEKIKKDYDYWTKFNYALDYLTPESVFLGTVEKQDSVIKMSGYARTKKDAVDFLDLLKVSKLFSSTNVESIKTVDHPSNPNSGVKVENFNFTLRLTEGALR